MKNKRYRFCFCYIARLVLFFTSHTNATLLPIPHIHRTLAFCAIFATLARINALIYLTRLSRPPTLPPAFLSPHKSAPHFSAKRFCAFFYLFLILFFLLCNKNLALRFCEKIAGRFAKSSQKASAKMQNRLARL